jgi:hypothetical protein
VALITRVWHGTCFIEGKVSEDLNTLRITFQNSAEAVEMKLEGRVAGPWAGELNRVWVEAAPQLGQRKLIVDLHNVTYADAAGKEALKAIYDQTHAQFVANTPWTQFLAEEARAAKVVSVQEGE